MRAQTSLRIKKRAWQTEDQLGMPFRFCVRFSAIWTALSSDRNWHQPTLECHIECNNVEGRETSRRTPLKGGKPKFSEWVKLG